ncbi:MAG: hypothetical protein M3Q50_09540, partial [Chloroflexota bacterium]|nr:hypothetical protein [Chloroflexota bacterium]
MAIGAIVLALLAAGAGWRFLSARQSIPDWERLPELASAAPAGDAFQPETPWVQLRLSPARPGEENTLQVSLAAPRGTPVPSAAPGPRITGLTAQPLTAGAPTPQLDALPPPPGDEGWLAATSALEGEGWWRLSVA